MTIYTPLGFAEKLVKLVVAEEFALHEGLKVVAKGIEKTAKKEIGHYQSAVGEFPAWAQLAESTEREKERLGYNRNEPLLRTGDLRDSIQHEVEGFEAVIGSKSQVMVYHEFGTVKMPARPVIGPAAYRNKEKIKRILGEAAVIGLTEGNPITKLESHENLID
jgi:HK97 gp10 family phage protein